MPSLLFVRSVNTISDRHIPNLVLICWLLMKYLADYATANTGSANYYFSCFSSHFESDNSIYMNENQKPNWFVLTLTCLSLSLTPRMCNSEIGRCDRRAKKGNKIRKRERSELRHQPRADKPFSTSYWFMFEWKSLSPRLLAGDNSQTRPTKWSTEINMESCSSLRYVYLPLIVS